MNSIKREQLIEGMKEDTLFLDKVENVGCIGNPREINELLTTLVGEQAIDAKYEVGEEYLYRAWPFVLHESNGEKFYFLAGDIGNTNFNFVCEMTHDAIMEVINKANDKSVSEMLYAQRKMVETFKESSNINQDNLVRFESAITEIQKYFPVNKYPFYVPDFDKISSYDVLQKLTKYKGLVELSEHVDLVPKIVETYQETLDNLIKFFEYVNEVYRTNAVHAELAE